ncbi:MAG: energy-coupling factor ABC transporter substrate-binding protein [Geminocystis sp.]|nr:energy-coupling factor ABC transporter substrate-binding protein [Geminocystis sp.]MCS7147844.1 energy-coupling factor ABC transporter substrate-binding protein [Geminocystis sp.]MDW8116789.1 energy-coupling factor ABC transporter substrate-binding protein [Geminocystis sp.]MDW8464012.1 energy-coupling factor ABC transporter substrate-binding protein [Geminocystis sp.]
MSGNNKGASGLENWLLMGVVLCLALFPLVFVKGEFEGADSQAEEAVTAINPSYRPWAENLFKPASGEIESFLFALQAGIGAGTIGYVLGYYRGKKR